VAARLAIATSGTPAVAAIPNATFWSATATRTLPFIAISATVANRTVEGTIGTAITTNNTFVVTLVNDEFTTSGFVGTGWITDGLPAGLTATAVRTTATTATITITGTPEAIQATTVPVEITIPADSMTNRSSVLVVTANTSANFNIRENLAPGAAATGTVTGINGGSAVDVDVTINLTNETFTGLTTGMNVATWITNLPANWTAVIRSSTTTQAVIRIQGSPVAVLNEVAMTIAIPNANLGTTDSGTLPAAGATWAIREAVVATASNVALATDIAEFTMTNQRGKLITITLPSSVDSSFAAASGLITDAAANVNIAGITSTGGTDSRYTVNGRILTITLNSTVGGFSGDSITVTLKPAAFEAAHRPSGDIELTVNASTPKITS
jgi:tetrahydromethanopterin S-methyltransferase subunit A